MPLIQESIFILVEKTGDKLHLRRIRRADRPAEAAAFLLHGAIENGRIFYDAKGEKGLAPFLASAGFDVFVADLRGRGLSSPHLSRKAAYGQTESITEEIPLFLQAIREYCPDLPLHWIAHSWGGVLMASHLARFPDAPRPLSLICFGSKRSISVQNWRKWIFIDLLWNRLGRLLSFIFGYLPARLLGLGSDDETRRSHAQSVAWVRSLESWVDPADGFDYRQAIKTLPTLRVLFLAAPLDYYLGHPRDVQRFMGECNFPLSGFHMLSRKNGHQVDYDHVNMLTHPAAICDHFPKIVDWLRNKTEKVERL